MKNRVKAASAVLCLAIFISWSAHMASYAHTPADSVYLNGSWQKDDTGWWFSNTGNPPCPSSAWGEYYDNSYYFDSDGYLATGWRYLDDHWYYFNPSPGKTQGAMVRGWIRDTGRDGWFYTNQSGIMVTGWHKIDGSWYYFNPGSDGVEGLMAADEVADGSYVDKSGRMNEPRG